jgi:hypothetical protein
LILFALLPVWALAGFRRRSAIERRALLGLTATWLGLIALIVFVYVAGRWSGFRYLMFLMPCFLPWVTAGPDRRRLAAPVVALSCALMTISTWRILNDFKASRMERQRHYADYVDGVVDARLVRRAVFPRGLAYGLRHPRLEVILDLPRGGGGGLRAFEREISFELLVLPRDHALVPELDTRLKYRRLDHNPGADLAVYRRLR